MQQAIELWPYPKTTYCPPNMDNKSLTLMDLESLAKSIKPSRCEINGVRLDCCNSWKALYVAVIEYLVADSNYSTIILKLAKNVKYGLRDNEPNDGTRTDYTQISGENLWARTCCDTKTKLVSLSNIFDKCNISQSVLKIWSTIIDDDLLDFSEDE